MDKIIIDGQEYEAVTVVVKDRILHGVNEIEVDISYTAMAIYRVVKLFKNVSIFDVIYDDREYQNCSIKTVSGNFTGSSRTQLVNFIISY
jgi:hypothetical protein